ncbi:MAG: hypothetical protein ACP5SH_26895, partial [Syntrophobacteraceae bacterium]
MNVEAFIASQEGGDTSRNPLPSQIAVSSDYLNAARSLVNIYGEAIEAFDGLPPQDMWRRRAVKQFMAGLEVKRIEDGMDKEFYFLRTDPDGERRKLAAARIGEGIEY